MLVTVAYNRELAVAYAEKWAFARNPLFYNFTGIGGDCTSYVSQCVYAGCCEMNYCSVNGWYYDDIDHRSPSWTGVNFFYEFLMGNQANGPFAAETNAGGLQIGDVIQLKNEAGRFYHTLLVTGFDYGTYLVSAHSDDAFDRPLDSYQYESARFLHIEGVREYRKDSQVCFYNFYNGISFA